MSNTAEVVNIEEHRPVVKADIENGYDRLAHPITSMLAKNAQSLCGVEYQIILALVAKTYRFQKKTDWITNTQLMAETGLNKSQVSRYKKRLMEKKIIIEVGSEIGINPVVSEWEVVKSDNPNSCSNRQPELPNQTTAVAQSGNKSCSIGKPHKKETNTKETNTKEKRAKSRYSIPEELPVESIENFIADRKDRKQPMTEQAIKIFITKCLTAQVEGYDVKQLIDESIVNGWKSIFPKPQFKSKKSSIPHSGFSDMDYGETTANFDEVFS